MKRILLLIILNCIVLSCINDNTVTKEKKTQLFFLYTGNGPYNYNFKTSRSEILYIVFQRQYRMATRQYCISTRYN